MTIDRASVEEGARLAAEATPGPWKDVGEGAGGSTIVSMGDGFDPLQAPDGSFTEATAAFIAHWNPEFAAELARELLHQDAELLRLLRVEEALAEIARSAWPKAWESPGHPMNGWTSREDILRVIRKAAPELAADLDRSLAADRAALANPAAEEEA